MLLFKNYIKINVLGTLDETKMGLNQPFFFQHVFHHLGRLKDSNSVAFCVVQNATSCEVPLPQHLSD